MKDNHLIFIIHAKHVAFSIDTKENGLNTGSNPHNGSVVGVNRQINAIMKRFRVKTVEYIWSDSLPK